SALVASGCPLGPRLTTAAWNVAPGGLLLRHGSTCLGRTRARHLRIVHMTGHRVPFAGIHRLRPALAADRPGMRAARMERTPRWRIHRAGHLALQGGLELLLHLGIRIGDR